MSSIQRELMGLEKDFWRSMKEKDAGLAARLTADSCILTGAQGVSVIGKDTMGKMLEGATWTIDDFEVRDVQTRQLADDVAIIGYKVREQLTVDGKPLTLDAADASVWVRQNGGWVCAMHTESILGDPFGRDRRPAAGNA